MQDKVLIEQLSVNLGDKLRSKGYWITSAESCTGGLIAKIITDIAGSSAYFDRGFVTYSNNAKKELLGVKESTLSVYGAVSEQVAIEMAEGAMKAAAADIAVSVSGIAGPEGGTNEKPVGTVCFGIASKTTKTSSHTVYFSGSRGEVRLQAAVFIIKKICDDFL